MSIPPAAQPIVPLSIAPSCAAVSMPRASPETTTSPSPPRSCARPRAKRQAGGGGIAGPDHRHRGPVEQLEVTLARSATAARPRVQPAAPDKGLGRGPGSARRAGRRRRLAFGLVRLVMRGAAPPPRRARSGKASSAASAPPKRCSNWRKVTGPDPGASRKPDSVDQIVVQAPSSSRTSARSRP